MVGRGVGDRTGLSEGRKQQAMGISEPRIVPDDAEWNVAAVNSGGLPALLARLLALSAEVMR